MRHKERQRHQREKEEEEHKKPWRGGGMRRVNEAGRNDRIGRE